mgnify:CR=1 FL=1
MPPSLSARRAWIEIASRGCGTPIVPVALRKESVDRNISSLLDLAPRDAVALRKESVDRNINPLHLHPSLQVSLSARRAWIEILDKALDKVSIFVALRKESVDRNTLIQPLKIGPNVALRKESVDRNDRR